MDNLDIFHQLNDIWSSRFNATMQCVTILAAIFGFGIPSVAAWFQHKRLKYERERWDKDMERRLADFEKQKELIVQQNLRIGELQDLAGNAYVALANYYLDELVRIKVVWNDPTRTDDQKQDDMRRTLIYFGNAFHCLVNSKNRGQLVEVMDAVADPMSEIIMRDQELLKKVVNGLRQSNPRNNFFVTSEDLAEIAGSENCVYKKFVSKFQMLFELVDLYYPGENRTQP
ncbi:MAG: hypothetical protein J6Y54_06040 [Lentisphaeria bacterium]|nr:hypothetical protein [Lentisphaeria bacterium]